MFDQMKSHLQAELAKIKDAGLWKDERVLASARRLSEPAMRLGSLQVKTPASRSSALLRLVTS